MVLKDRLGWIVLSLLACPVVGTQELSQLDSNFRVASCMSCLVMNSANLSLCKLGFKKKVTKIKQACINLFDFSVIFIPVNIISTQIALLKSLVAISTERCSVITMQHSTELAVACTVSAPCLPRATRSHMGILA